MKTAVRLILAIVTITALLLTSCGPKPTPVPTPVEATPVPVEATPITPPEEITLEFWSMWNEPEPQAEVLKKYAEGFEAETGIKVNITFNGRENQTLLRTALGAGEKVDLMDQDGAPLAGGLMKEGLGYALDEWLDEDAWGEPGQPFRDIFRPGLLEQFQLEGKTYLIPHTLITYAIWHDKRDFAAAGIDKLPETWDEFLEACEKIKATGVEPIAQDAGVPFYNIIWFFYLVERLKGPEFLLAAAEDPTGALWDDPAFLKAAEMERELWDNYVIEGAEGFTWPQGQQTLADDISAMELCGSWLPNELKEAVDPEFEWGGLPFPAVEGGEGKGTDIPVVMLDFMVLKDSEHPREAFDFIRYCLSKENVQMWADDTISGVPRNDVSFPDLIADAEDMFKNATAFFDEVDGVVFRHAEYANNVLFPTHDEVFMGRITPEEFVAKMKELTITYWETREAPPEAEAPSEAETITVIFPSHEADWADAFEPRIRQFEEESGIKVELIQSDWDSIADRVIPELATGGSAYDVVEFDNGWVNEWCGAGWTTPLDDYMPEGYTDGMIPGLVDLFSCPDGTLHGIVWNNDTRFFFYNATKLAEAGFDTPPATWDEFVAQSLAAKDAGVVEYGMAPFWNQEWSLANELHFWTYAFGGEIVDKEGCFLFNEDPNTLAALEFMIESLNSGVSDPAGLTYDQATAQDVFLSGRVLFVPQGMSGLMAWAEDPSLSSVAGEVQVDIVPGVEAGQSAALTLPEAYAIPANSEHKEAAWQFIEFMTSKETNVLLAKQLGMLPIWVDLYTDPELTGLYPFWADFSAQLDTARGLSTLTWYGDFVDISTAEVHKALAGEQSAQEALDAMAEGLAEFECTP